MDIENNNINANGLTNDNPTLTAQTPMNLDNIEIPTNNVVNNQNSNTDGNTKKSKKGRKLLFFLLGILVGIIFYVAYSKRTVYQYKKGFEDLIDYYQDLSNKGHENQKSGLYSFTSSGSYNGEVTYGLQAVDGDDFDYEGYLNGDDSSLLSYYANLWEAKLKDYPWIEGLINFRPFIYLDLTFSGSELIERNIVDKKTKEPIGKLTADELDKKYNYEASHKINELNIEKEKINLSELKEGEIYQYKVNSGSHTNPKFTNDLNQIVILYEKSNNSWNNSMEYDTEVLFHGDYDGGGYEFSSDDHTYNIYYKIFSTEELVKELGDDVIYISKYNIGEQKSMWLEESKTEYGTIRSGLLGHYMYNDTNKTLAIKSLEDDFGEIEELNTINIQKGEIIKIHEDCDAFIVLDEIITEKTNKEDNNLYQETISYEIQNNEEISVENTNYTQGTSQARVRDINRKNDLAQLQTAIITSQSDKGAWPGTEYNTGNNGFSGAEKGAKIKDITDELYKAGMSSIPRDQDNENLVYGLGAEYRTKELAEKNGAKGDYLYLVSTRHSIRRGGFVLMAKTETEEGSNWVVCKEGQGLENGYIKRGIDIIDIKTCQKIVKGDTCSSNADTCTYTDEEELRYILMY